MTEKQHIAGSVVICEHLSETGLQNGIREDVLHLLCEADPSLEHDTRPLADAVLYRAEVNGLLTGIAAGVCREGKVFEITAIAVSEPYRGRRTGRMLVEHMLGAAKARNCSKVIVKTGSCGVRQLKFYQSLGFRVTGIVHDHFIRTFSDPIVEQELVCRDQLELTYRFFTLTERRTAQGEYWKKAAAAVPSIRGEQYQVWSFGYGEYVPNYLLALVKSGVKTGTSSAYELYELDGEELPRCGDISMIAYGNGMPGAIVQTVEVLIKPFDEISEEEAYAEGEGDRSQAYWREAHEHFFRREYDDMGLPFHRKIPVVFERFRVLYAGDLPWTP
jgi:uncharacterized protein YhfF/ribosomal protein S18 acetylase RimI-like enzyme